MDEVLVASDLRREYGGTTALSGVSLTLSAGEAVALVGPNGAGKTTFVRSVLGTTAAEGTVELFGRPPAAVDRSRIGLLPQSFGPHDRLTVRELLSYYAGLYDDPRDVDAVLEDVGLAAAADTWYERCSGGQRRRCCVGTALINDPDLLVLDEPTTGIDPAGRRALWSLLEDLVAAGVTLLLTTHDMAEAERLADRVALLAEGELVAVDAPEALVAEHGGDPRVIVTGAFDPEVGADLPYPTTVGDGTLALHGVPATDIGAATEALREAGIDFEELTWARPSLEDAYLELTGDADLADVGGAGGLAAGDERDRRQDAPEREADR